MPPLPDQIQQRPGHPRFQPELPFAARAIIHELSPRFVVQLVKGLADKRAKLLRTHGGEGSLNVRLDP